MRTRLALGAVGVALGLVGGWMLLDDGWTALRSLATYLVGGVVLHDFVVVPIVLGIGWLVLRRLPRPTQGPLLVGFAVWGSMTLVALPALSGQGVKPDNPTLLPRDYLTGWLVATLAIAIVAAAAAVRAVRRSHARPDLG